MDWGLLLEYGWVLLVLVALEGLLAADNALVLAIMVKHLPDEERKKHCSTVWQGHSYSGSVHFLSSRIWWISGKYKLSGPFTCYS